MRYFRARMHSRRFLLVTAIVGVVVLGGTAAVAFATVGGYPTNGVTVMTGCLTASGTGAGNIVNIAANSTTPSKACGANQKLVHLSGGTITEVTAGTGLTVAGSGGTDTGGDPNSINNGFATLGLQSSYQLPQSNCSSGQFVASDGSGGWSCQSQTTYSGTNFAKSSQDCTAGQFVTGIDANGNLKCAQPTLDNLACTFDGHTSTLQVNTDSTTGAVSLTCKPVYELKGTSTGGDMGTIFLLDDTNNSLDHDCNNTNFCSELVPADDKVKVVFRAATSYSFMCSGDAATYTPPPPHQVGGPFDGACPQPDGTEVTLNADYAATATFSP